MSTIETNGAAKERLTPVKLLRKLGHSSIFFYGGAWLIVLLVVGTVAQVDDGLYMAQETYFSSWFVWLGPLPLPGGRLTMGILVFNLVLSLVFYAQWRWDRSGVIIGHIGTLLLLAGGFLTALYASEGTMLIPEGGSSSVVEDYHAIELAVVDTTERSFDDVVAFGEGLLEPGQVLSETALPLTIEVLSFHRNATTDRRKGAADRDVRGLAKGAALKSLPLDKQHERNRAGAAFKVSGAGKADGVYLAMQDMRRPETLVSDTGRRFQLNLRRRRTPLSFSLELIDFQKKLHPGTGMAKAYSSTLNLVDGDGSRRVVVQMNEPLRHRGYTFFQSSFIEGKQGESTILAVVENVGRLFPYIASIVICLGLMLHLLLKVPKLIRRSNHS